MTQDSQKTLLNDLPQVYDTSLKDWIFQQAPSILPVLLPGAIYEQTLDVEIIRPPMRVDKVFKILYHGKEQIKERLSMFDQLFEESPMIQKLRQQYLEQGEMLTLRRMLVNVVRTRYSDLAEFAQQQASRFDNPGALELLIQKVVTAPDASTVHWLLESGTQQ